MLENLEYLLNRVKLLKQEHGERRQKTRSHAFWRTWEYNCAPPTLILIAKKWTRYVSVIRQHFQRNIRRMKIYEAIC